VSRSNDAVVRKLDELVELMKLEEGSPQAFRVRAYEKAVGAVRDLTMDVATLSAAELQKLEGIGKSTAAKIREYLDTGTIATLDALRDKYPPALVELTRIPGMGPKTVLLLRDRLGVESLEQLQAALAEEKLRDLPGLGAKTEEKIARAIERLGLHGKERRTPIAEALPLAARLVATLGDLPDVKRIEYCGSLRRFRETIGDIDIIIAATRPEPIMDAFVGLDEVDEVLGHGETKSSVVMEGGIQVDLRVVAPAEFGAAILYFTGSKQHNIELRQRAIDRGWILNEYALADAETEDTVASRTEKAVYDSLGLRLIPPELREGVGEIEAAETGALPRSLTVADIRGDLHVHSLWSGDGRSELAEMVAAVSHRGLEYVAITEHGEDLAINGLSRDQVRAERKELTKLRRTYPELTILHGAELNIAPDGSLDYDHEFLMEFDFCVASVHSHFDLPRAEQTARVVRAMQHPAVNVIGHLTGRMIGRRPGIELDHDAVFDAAAATGAAIEVNGHLDRLDCPPDVARRFRDRSDVAFALSTDAHHVNELRNMEWAVRAARRGWIDKRRVVNTWPRAKFLSWVEAKRSAEFIDS
jgi:DNA polymerase (family 10)